MFGASLHVPLNDRFAIDGQGNFILPADSGTVDSSLGIVYDFGPGRAKRRSRFASPLDVAGTTSFAVDLER